MLHIPVQSNCRYIFPQHILVNGSKVYRMGIYTYYLCQARPALLECLCVSYSLCYIAQFQFSFQPLSFQLLWLNNII
ncbi:hypothetical protein EB796_014847 [Bugula neritina]|uniref:Uncharacterized protein n=1 Tax=Bugula neritina TaxID=10212 RepID=A0A7J7JLU3_BUGNE|nr:hypothetical protein EB796_014847 [Bugula neritina]